jgi:isopenicillin-N N-acyltransferase like protein
MKRRWALASVAAACAAVGLYVGISFGRSHYRPGTAPGQVLAAVTAPIPSSAASAPLAEPFPVPIVELRGDSADLGSEHGVRLRDSIRTLHDGYLKRYLRSDLERFLALKAAEAFRGRIGADYQDEVGGLAKACDLDGREAMLAQCFLDITGMVACSTVTLPPEAAPDHVARFGRNLDFPSFNIADKYTTVFVYHPEGKYAFASVGWPGMIGVLSGMNEHGLTIANMEVTRGPRLPQALPYTLLYRKLLEECRTTEEALDLLCRTPRQTSNNLMIMDAAGSRAVAEISPEGVTVRRPDEYGLVSTNHRRGEDNCTTGRCDRYDSLRAASVRDFGRIDVATLEAMLAGASQGKSTLQSMVFEPSNRVLYLSAQQDAARGRFHRLDLKGYLGSQNGG